MNRTLAAVAIAAVSIASIKFSAATQPNQTNGSLARAHAHNDYLHTRPLLDALDHRFASVEADVFLVEGGLWVAHTQEELEPQRTLRELYLDPLRKRIEANAGSVHGDDQPFTLLIDIKSQGQPTYEALDRLLAEYGDVFTHVLDGQVHRRPVTAIVSGNRASETIAADRSRYVGIDGRLDNLSSTDPPHLMPLISDHWGRNFRWRGEGEMNPEDRQKLREIVDRCHRSGRRVRFWATPDQPSVWAALRDADVDLINTDDLDGLSRFLSDDKVDRSAAAAE